MVAWTDTTERQLLLSVIQSASLSKINWDQVALLMGDGYTASGVMYAALLYPYFPPTPLLLLTA